jgi:membrane associated rhomboid family serine protease
MSVVAVVIILILLIVIISLIGFNNSGFFKRYSFSVSGILYKKQIDRLIISIFLHVDYIHLFFNLFSFYSFAIHIERGLGSLFLAVLFFGSALGGNFLALFLHRKHPDYSAIGASGAVSGVIFASVLIYPEGSILIFPIPIGMPPWLFAILFVLISIYGIGKQAGNIGHEAHLGGALTGILITGILYPWIIKEHLFLTFAIVTPVSLFLYFYVRNPEILHIDYRNWFKDS